MSCFAYTIFQSCDVFSQTIIYGLKYVLWSVLRIDSMYCWACLYLSLCLLPSENSNKVFLYEACQTFCTKQDGAGNYKIQMKTKHLWTCLRRQLKPIYFAKKKKKGSWNSWISLTSVTGSWQHTKGAESAHHLILSNSGSFPEHVTCNWELKRLH